jgi:hypothetical protein
MGGSVSAGNPNITPELGNIDSGFKGQTLPTFNSFFNKQPLLDQSRTLASGALQGATPWLENIIQNQGALTPEQNRDVTQATRSEFAARGNVMGNQAIGATLLNRDQFRQNRLNQAISQEQGLITPALQTEQTATSSFAQLINPLYSLFENTQNADLQAQIANQNKQAGLIGSGISSIGSIAGAAIGACDERFKENIVDTGEKTADDIPIKEFNYKGDDERWVGMTAQDVAKVRPDAVITLPLTGHKLIDLSKLRDPVMHRK